MDLREHLETCYAQDVTAEFSHVVNEDERIWLHENYEESLVSEVSQ
jgi:2-oxoglutarate dehydrogenase complex dehydrogenase (E1) component-like enzyme